MDALLNSATKPKPLGPWRKRHRRDPDRPKGKLRGLTLIPFAMLFVVFPGNAIDARADAARELSIVTVGESATATVTATHRHSHYRGSTTVSPEATYTVDGRTYRHSFWKYTVPLRDEPDVGDRFQVLYDPDDPNRAVVSAQIGRFKEESDIRWFVFWAGLVISIAEVVLRLAVFVVRLLLPGSTKHTAGEAVRG